MSHFRQVRTRMKSLAVVDSVLRDRGYQPHYYRDGRQLVDLAGANRLYIPPEQVKTGETRRRFGISFLDAGQSIHVDTDTDVLYTGYRVSPELVNRAGNGINEHFEHEITLDYDKAMVLKQAAALGYDVDCAEIVETDDQLVIKVRKYGTTNYANPSLTTSAKSTVIL